MQFGQFQCNQPKNHSDIASLSLFRMNVRTPDTTQHVGRNGLYSKHHMQSNRCLFVICVADGKIRHKMCVNKSIITSLWLEDCVSAFDRVHVTSLVLNARIFGAGLVGGKITINSIKRYIVGYTLLRSHQLFVSRLLTLSNGNFIVCQTHAHAHGECMWNRVERVNTAFSAHKIELKLVERASERCICECVNELSIHVKTRPQTLERNER